MFNASSSKYVIYIPTTDWFNPINALFVRSPFGELPLFLATWGGIVRSFNGRVGRGNSRGSYAGWGTATEPRKASPERMLGIRESPNRRFIPRISSLGLARSCLDPSQKIEIEQNVMGWSHKYPALVLTHTVILDVCISACTFGESKPGWKFSQKQN